MFLANQRNQGAGTAVAGELLLSQAETHVSNHPAPLIRLRGIGKVYGRRPHKTVALRNVNLALGTGEFVILLGAEGSGKSTLLNILAGLERPSSGVYWFGKRDLAKASDAVLANYRRTRVGYIVKSPKLVPQLTLQENVALFARVAARPMRPDAALALVGLGKRVNQFPSQLSATEQYLVAIARAVAKRPKILICDQPTGSLAFDCAVSVVKALALASAILDLTVVVSTRSVKLKGMAERVVHLLDGRLVGERRRPAGSS
jgi:putative ABC transport system ATP-binding protein